MMSTGTKVVFLSAVAQEFQESDPTHLSTFCSYRDMLTKGFRRLGPQYVVRVQEDFADDAGDPLGTLDTAIAGSELVVHLVGTLAGMSPPSSSRRALLARHPNFLKDEPELSGALEHPPQPSLTQWALYLACEHKKHRLVYLADPSAPRSPLYAPPDGDDQEVSQNVHLQRWQATGEPYERFSDQSDLTLKAVTSAVRLGIGSEGATGTSKPDALEKAHEEAKTLVLEMCRLLKDPDRSVATSPDPAGVADFLQALDTAASQWELDRRGALQVLDKLNHQKRTAVAIAPTAGNLYELALAELALGRYRDATCIAQNAAEEALRQVNGLDVDGQGEIAVNALLLMHDAAKAAHDHETAIAAQEKAARQVDKDGSPVQWADINEALASYLLKLGRSRTAMGLINKIIDIREEHQPGERALAKTLLLWVSALADEGKVQRLDSVAARAERMFASLGDIEGCGSALTWQGVILQREGNYLGAKRMIERALEITGEQHPAFTTCLINLGRNYELQGNHEEATCFFRKALDVVQRRLGEEHQAVASSLDDLGRVYYRQGNYEHAEPLFRQALAMRQRLLGEESPAVASSLNNVGRLYYRQGKDEEAELLFLRALGIMKRLLGADHPKTQRIVRNLQQVRDKTKDRRI